ncbi:MAG TPA: hypothetical protein VGH10_05685 [Actinomycetota bacterium]|jgi:hypothetical protein
MQTLEDFELDLPGQIVCDYCGQLCRPEPACQWCGSPIKQDDMARLAERARRVESERAAKQAERKRLEEQARIAYEAEVERLRLEEETRLAAEAEARAEAERMRVEEAARAAYDAEVERLRLEAAAAEAVAQQQATEIVRPQVAAKPRAERKRRPPKSPAEQTECVRCGEPSSGGFCPACRDALSELRNLSDELSEYIKPPLSL